MALLLASLAALLATGAIAAALSRWPRVATGVGASGAVAACALGIGPALSGLSDSGFLVRWPWTPPYGDLVIGLDPLSAFFLTPLLALAAAAAIYGRTYLLQGARRPLGPPTFFFNVLIASLILILLARDAIVLLIAWEVMGLSSFLLVTFEHQETEVRRAGWIYLVASQLGAMLFIALLTLLIRHAGGSEFSAFRACPSPAHGSRRGWSRWRSSAAA